MFSIQILVFAEVKGTVFSGEVYNLNCACF